VTPPFQLVAGHVALDFTNTLDHRYDERGPTELLGSYGSFLEFGAQAGIISFAAKRRLVRTTTRAVAAEALHQVLEVREALYRLFLAVVNGRPPDASCLRTYNRFRIGLGTSEVIAWRDSGFVRSSRDRAETPLGPLGPIVELGGSLLTSPDRSHIRECCDSSCRWLFLDISKNHSRRWCSMQICGGRNKARRYYAREKAAFKSSP
jgi:predicted RNA-binding Zn ribbon-like protein